MVAWISWWRVRACVGSSAGKNTLVAPRRLLSLHRLPTCMPSLFLGPFDALVRVPASQVHWWARGVNAHGVRCAGLPPPKQARAAASRALASVLVCTHVHGPHSFSFSAGFCCAATYRPVSMWLERCTCQIERCTYTTTILISLLQLAGRCTYG